MTSVSAALIVRDEQRFLPACLKSLEGLVDDVVVVDTGSVDATIEIAERAGARVSTYTWAGDFAAARNAALDLIETDWVLYIDADERVSTPSMNPIGSILDPARHAGGFVRFRPRPNYTRYLEPRLFRSDPAIRFRYAVHESIVPDLIDFAQRRQLAVVPTQVCLDHYGFEGDQAHKVARNIPLLKAEVARHPARSYCWHHLAEMLLLAGRKNEAILACRAGLSVEWRSGSAKARADRRQLMQTYARLLIETADDAMDVIEELLDDDREDWAVVYLKGRALLDRGDFDGALAIGQDLAAVETDKVSEGLVAYDMRLFSDLAWALVAAAHHQAGRRVDAAHAFSEAWRRAPGETAYLAKACALGARLSRQTAS